ncbi:two-component sensor histidine kinase [Clostridioides difficile]|uniref:histidine kinase n=3 Tax=Clostridioides difficile TaxID=1496 RepID=A0AB74R870_CLODI|nr:sensor histidine kinase [Clostridioides difficile]OFU05377.1 two-component sensor histidine kinase [Clostridium sp. HMSC19E03]OFU20835.1 two-component sensor histidine kinase [Clostridium sp. HMSC19C09]OFU23656.1 two-component sensor histidine kinase [Clostridium sp. HMSC19C05]OFU24579.1 two-component sensor histidine kinase [Clostridium sp. HMSC19C08]OFU36034.1 two-component sensor histidine kinase [Clostridium sp. HMSC19B10]OFU46393.1 two-component sensor histidine kinase [Clostridium sp
MDKISNMSLKKAFFVLTLSSLIIASVLTTFAYILLNNLYNSIQDKYLKTPINTGIITIVQNNVNQFSDYDKTLLNIINILQLVLPLIFFIGLLLLADIIFYKVKLKTPIEILNKGAMEISNNNLDFCLEYNNNDELGNLCNAFEKMRSELNKNNINMWTMINDRKQLNAAFSHDLRNPLTVLKGYSNYLTKYIPTGKLSDEKILSTTQLMSEHINRIEYYVENMSNAQRLEDLVVSKSMSNINKFIENLDENISIIAKQEGKSFTLKSQINNINLFFDENIILRVVENIISNAFRYARNNVSILIYLEQELLTFVIEDDGIGFSKESLKLALRPFYRDKTLNDSNPHFGMGLHISKILCEKHGGSISIENNSTNSAKITAKFSTRN